MSELTWKPIKPLSDEDRAIDLPIMQPLYESWRAAQHRLKESSQSNLQTFNERLVRSLSIETGILERLYDLDRGTTEALVKHGFAEDYVSRSSTDIEPSRLIDILRDQEAAIQLVMDCISRGRSLTKGVLHELHATLTRHQDMTTAIDQFGKHLEIPLLKGQFKQQPNNPKRPDGSVHEYAPPHNVPLEIEKLLQWLEDYADDDPIIVAAWLHHRFTQIHPYQDGNGRVVRALTTLVLMKAELLPPVIDRDLRVEYIRALEAADFGSLENLVRLIARLERRAILQALSIDVDAEVSRDRSLTAAVIQSLAAKFRKRKEEHRAQLREVNTLATALRTRTRRQIEDAFTALKAPVAEIARADVHVQDGGPDKDNAHWYKHEVIKSGASSRKYINFSEDHYFVKASIRVGTERLVFVTSLHHVGRELSGIMEVTAFARLESYEDSDDRKSVAEDFSACVLEPFVIAWQSNEEDLAEAYEKWLDAGIAVAVKDFGDRL